MRARRDFSRIQRPVAYGIKFRSKLEARFARYLEFLLLAGKAARWQYEADTFSFSPDSAGARLQRLGGVRHGVTRYKPDFVVEWADGSVSYYEVKGYMDRRSRVALDRMKRYYPAVSVALVTADEVQRLGY